MIASGLTDDVLVWEKERGFTGPKGTRRTSYSGLQGMGRG